MSRDTIIDALEIMRKSAIMQKEPFKARAYQTVIAQLKTMATVTKEDIPLLKGAGDKITKKILEIMETGSLAAADRAKSDLNLDALDAFQKIYGVGAVKAKELVDQGFTTIEQLRLNPGVLHEKQQIGLKYYEALITRIPQKEMTMHEDMLLDTLHEIDVTATGTVTGSYRRNASSSGDIDFLIASNGTIHDIVHHLNEKGYLLEILALGKQKCMAICSLGIPRRLDIMVIPPNEYPFALLYFTGPQECNIAMRQHALDRGYTMNEHGITPLVPNKYVPPLKSEKDIFGFLGLEYLSPRHRSGQLYLHKQ